MDIILQLPESAYEDFRAHLFSKKGEMAAFMFAHVSKQEGVVHFDFLGMDLVQEYELENSGYYGIELGEDVWNRIMEKAFRLKASLIEAHSHPFSEKDVGFSHYDMKGFKELVPHLWWRMNGIPYGALVFGQNDFDALFWTESPHKHQLLHSIVMNEGKRLKPTNITSQYYKGNRQWKTKDMLGK